MSHESARKDKKGSIPTPEPQKLLTPFSQPHFTDSNNYSDRLKFVSEKKVEADRNCHASIP